MDRCAGSFNHRAKIDETSGQRRPKHSARALLSARRRRTFSQFSLGRRARGHRPLSSSGFLPALLDPSFISFASEDGRASRRVPGKPAGPSSKSVHAMILHTPATCRILDDRATPPTVRRRDGVRCLRRQVCSSRDNKAAGASARRRGWREGRKGRDRTAPDNSSCPS